MDIIAHSWIIRRKRRGIQPQEIKISGFGNFEVKQKKDRKGRNPQTAETITIEARKILSFKPSMLLRQAINK